MTAMNRCLMFICRIVYVARGSDTESEKDVGLMYSDRPRSLSVFLSETATLEVASLAETAFLFLETISALEVTALGIASLTESAFFLFEATFTLEAVFLLEAIASA